jgi:hypothetical protein
MKRRPSLVRVVDAVLAGLRDETLRASLERLALVHELRARVRDG